MMKIQTIYLFGKRIDVSVPEEEEDEVIVMFEKELETSDVSMGQSRLFLPDSSKVEQWLSKEDMEKLTVAKQEEPSSSSEEENATSTAAATANKKPKRKSKGLEVEVKDGEGRRFRLNLAYWDSVKKFVLNRGWNELVKQNSLQKGDVIQLSCYARRTNNNNNGDGDTTLLHLGLEIRKRSSS